MKTRTWVARNLAAAFLAGEWAPRAMEEAALRALGESAAPDWLTSLIAELRERWVRGYPPGPRQLVRLVLDSKTFQEQWFLGERRPRVARIVTASPRFAPDEQSRGTGVPEMATTAALADWLTLPFSLLEWLADTEGYRTRMGAVRHYSTTWISKRAGPPRLIEAPKPILKSIQRQILHEILDRVPAHDCAHGYRKGRSCLSAAQVHAGESVLVCADLKDFFLRIHLGRVHGLFRSLGYPEHVARVLTALCSTATPGDILARLPAGQRLDDETRRLFGQRHLPQGAPTSPALANLCIRHLDCRLSGLAGHLDARYTRYGDDLAFSGDREFARRTVRFLTLLREICAESGLHLNPRKTRVMSQGGRQRLLGLVVNQHVNVPRARYDRLKATLHNCARHGPEGQNRTAHHDFRAHLEGQVAWVESVNLRRGHRLRLMLERIEWP